MKEQLKAEAYVYKERTALMELTKGCEIKLKRDKWTKCFIAEEATPGVPAVVHLHGVPSVYLTELDGKNLKIIGHPINLQDWLAVLSKLGVSVTAYVLENGLTEVEIDYEARIYFNLTDGQPNSPADYKAFNEITSL